MGACIDISSFIEGSGVLSQHFIHMLRLYDSKRERKKKQTPNQTKNPQTNLSLYIYSTMSFSCSLYSPY